LFKRDIEKSILLFKVVVDSLVSEMLELGSIDTVEEIKLLEVSGKAEVCVEADAKVVVVI
jgi:hypothetical protein